MKADNHADFNGDSLTISAWIKINKSFSGNGTNVIVHKPYTSHSGEYYQWGLYVGGDEYRTHDDKFTFGISEGLTNGAGITLEPDEVVGHWLHLTGVLDETAGEARFYLNGQLVASNETDITIDQFDTNVFFGKQGNLHRTIDHTPMDLDDVRLYNKGLSSTEVESIYLNELHNKVSNDMSPIISDLDAVYGDFDGDGVSGALDFNSAIVFDTTFTSKK